MSNRSHPSPFPRKTNILGWRVWRVRGCFRGGVRPRRSRRRHTPCVPELEDRLFQVSPWGFASTILQLGRGMPACTALPFSPSSSPDTLRRQGEKWICLGLRVVEVFPAARRSLCGQLSRPSQRRNYLLAFSGFRWLSRFSGC